MRAFNDWRPREDRWRTLPIHASLSVPRGAFTEDTCAKRRLGEGVLAADVRCDMLAEVGGTRAKWNAVFARMRDNPNLWPHIASFPGMRVRPILPATAQPGLLTRDRLTGTRSNVRFSNVASACPIRRPISA